MNHLVYVLGPAYSPGEHLRLLNHFARGFKNLFQFGLLRVLVVGNLYPGHCLFGGGGPCITRHHSLCFSEKKKKKTIQNQIRSNGLLGGKDWLGGRIHGRICMAGKICETEGVKGLWRTCPRSRRTLNGPKISALRPHAFARLFPAHPDQPFCLCSSRSLEHIPAVFNLPQSRGGRAFDGRRRKGISMMPTKTYFNFLHKPTNKPTTAVKATS
jgi:hypothetical protein